ncbi:hypothetical protein D6C84_02575 [Aureobasidium pullulans]|uniref:Uncharacterized protein n=1 Tax=Aureobasidium pullulans TaxID=5580 RepID=A0A4S9Y1Y1_AURPU|nr:hypothetical protein D6C84_02575 [Aureobasidium pullulans]
MSASNPAAPMATHNNSHQDEKAGWPIQTAEEIGTDTGPSFDAAALDQNFAAAALAEDFDFATADFGTLPDLFTMEGQPTENNYGHNNHMIVSNNNHFDGDYDEARTAKTPGWSFGHGNADNMSYQTAVHANEGYHSYGGQIPLQPSSDAYGVQTPYVNRNSFSPRYESPTNNYDRVPEHSFNIDDSTMTAEDFVPPESPLAANFAASTVALPTTKPGSAKKTTNKAPKKTPAPRTKSLAKSKSKAPLIEDDSGADDDEEGRKVLPTTRPKGKGKAVVVEEDDAGDNEEEAPKSRASTRSKGKERARPFVAADDGEDEDEDEDGDSRMKTALTAASANKGKGRKRPAAGKAPVGAPSKKPKSSTPRKSALKKTTTGAQNTMGHQRKRGAAKNGVIISTKPIPNSFEDCSEGDKVLITTRDAGGSWAECKAAYFKATGIQHGNSTLPNRYERLKTAFIDMRDEDNLHLFDAKKNIEEEFNKTKWAMISKAIEDKSGSRVDPMDLKRRFKQLMEKTGFAVDEGFARKDVDFMGEGDDFEEDVDVENTPEPSRKLPNIEWDPSYEDEEDAVGGAELEHYDGNEDARDFDDSHFEDSRFDDTHFDDSRFEDTRFDDSNFEHSRFEQYGQQYDQQYGEQDQEQMDVDDDDEEADRGAAW